MVSTLRVELVQKIVKMQVFRWYKYKYMIIPSGKYALYKCLQIIPKKNYETYKHEPAG
jgi:hypothetical protein